MNEKYNPECQCKAIAKSTKERCKNQPLPGEEYCKTHIYLKSRYHRYLSWQKQNLSWIGWISAFISAVVLLITIFGFLPSLTGKPLLPEPLEKMSGEFNIAVAKFSDKNGEDSEYGKDVASVFSNRLKTELEEFSRNSETIKVIEVLEPTVLGSISGNFPEIREMNALDLANEVGAHMVVYGTIEQQNNDILVYPEFVISSKFITDAEELLGQYRFGTPIVIKDSIDNFQDRLFFNKEMSDRSSALASITIGLINYFSGNYEVALDYFELADSYESWDLSEGKEVIKILLGNAYIKLDKFDNAIDNYNLAIEINDEYSRGYIGLATAKLRKGIQHPEDIDYSLIYQSIENFNQAIDSLDKPKNSFIDLKSSFGLGEARLMLSQVGIEDQLNNAKKDFQQVQDRFNMLGKDVYKEIVWERYAQSFAHLGLISYIQASSMDEVSRYYQGAVKTAIEFGDPDLAALYWLKLSSLYEKQNDLNNAIQSIDRALEVVGSQELHDELDTRRQELLIVFSENQ